MLIDERQKEIQKQKEQFESVQPIIHKYLNEKIEKFLYNKSCYTLLSPEQSFNYTGEIRFVISSHNNYYFTLEMQMNVDHFSLDLITSLQFHLSLKPVEEHIIRRETTLGMPLLIYRMRVTIDEFQDVIPSLRELKFAPLRSDN